QKEDGCQGRDKRAKMHPPVRSQMHASSSHGGVRVRVAGFLCSAGPQQVKGGTGSVGIVERDAISPGRASWHYPIHVEDAPLKTRSLKKTLPPKKHAPEDWSFRTAKGGREKEEQHV
ncbi:hypothetical protein XENOCAPTIV_024891, partial [Xenoophorus captivus]